MNKLNLLLKEAHEKTGSLKELEKFTGFTASKLQSWLEGKNMPSGLETGMLTIKLRDILDNE